MNNKLKLHGKLKVFTPAHTFVCLYVLVSKLCLIEPWTIPFFTDHSSAVVLATPDNSPPVFNRKKKN